MPIPASWWRFRWWPSARGVRRHCRHCDPEIPRVTRWSARWCLRSRRTVLEPVRSTPTWKILLFHVLPIASRRLVVAGHHICRFSFLVRGDPSSFSRLGAADIPTWQRHGRSPRAVNRLPATNISIPPDFSPVTVLSPGLNILRRRMRDTLDRKNARGVTRTV